MIKKKNQKGHTVGYKHPPQHSQFKPGQSGNPKGRPKKAPSLTEALLKEMKKRVPIIRNGKKGSISMLDGIAKQLANKAANGDPKLVALLFKVLASEKITSADPLSDLVQEFRALYIRNELNNTNQNNSHD